MFKVNIEQQKLIKALHAIQGSVGKGKQQNPTDKMVYMQAYTENNINKLKLITTNFNEWTSVTVDLTLPITEGIAPLVEYDRLLSLASTISPTIEIELSEVSAQGITLNYVGRKTPIEIACHVYNDFAVPPQITPTLTTSVPGSVFKSGLEKASKVIIDSDQKPLFNCVNITVNPANIIFEAIDGISNRIMAYVVPNTNTSTGKFFVECNKLKNMITGFDDSKPITINVCANNISVVQDNITAMLRLMNGGFPNTLQHMPNQYKNAIAFNKQEMINALKRIQSMYDSTAGLKTCLCQFDNMFSTIKSNSTCGKITESVVTNLSGTAFDKTLVVDTMLRSLYTIETADVQMVEYDRGHICLSPVGAQGYVYKLVVQPVQTK